MGVKFKITKASDWEYGAEVEVNTLDDLKDLALIHGCSRLIVDFTKFADVCGITIYDDYVE